MADQATYILMGAYIALFAGLFVCVFGAIIVLVREQTASERPEPAIDQPRAARPPVVMADARHRAPTMAGSLPTRANPAS